MFTAFLIAIIVVSLFVLGLGFLVLGALRALALLSWRLEQLEATTPRRLGRDGLPPGKRAPNFTLPSVQGGDLSLHDFAGHRVLLVFTQNGCGPCHAIVPELNKLPGRHGDLQVLMVMRAELPAAQHLAREAGPRFPLLVQEDLSVSKRYEVFATPFAFLIDERGVIASKGIVTSREHIGFLLDHRQQHAAQVARVEAPAGQPEVRELEELPTLSLSTKGA
jgi:peroxiredoxin